jgi:hypothetical protein
MSEDVIKCKNSIEEYNIGIDVNFPKYDMTCTAGGTTSKVNKLFKHEPKQQ